MLDRIPDTGAQRRDRQGPRTAVPLSTVEAIRAARAAGSTPSELARSFRLTTRTIYRYLAPADPLHAAIRGVLTEASRAYGLDLTRNQLTDTADEIARQLRLRGWVS
jgi:hypothetical protein